MLRALTNTPWMSQRSVICLVHAVLQLPDVLNPSSTACAGLCNNLMSFLVSKFLWMRRCILICAFVYFDAGLSWPAQNALCGSAVVCACGFLVCVVVSVESTVGSHLQCYAVLWRASRGGCSMIRSALTNTPWLSQRWLVNAGALDAQGKLASCYTTLRQV